MNKVTKASIAAAAGVVLLMGGAGSLAYWNDTANTSANGSTITAGTLSIAAVGTGSWTKGLYNAAGTQTVAPAAVTTLSDVRIVPGNRLTYTQTFNITASGDDLFFTVSKTDGVVGTPASPTAADTALATQINASSVPSKFTVTSVSGGNVTTSTTAGTYKLSSNTGGPSTITVTWIVDFPFGATAVNTAKGGIVSLSAGAVTLTQVANP